MSEKKYVFFGNISWVCPVCGTKTIYRREGLDGISGEGQFCPTCKKFLQEIVPLLKFPPPMTMIESDVLFPNMVFIQEQINDAYEKQRTKVRRVEVS